MKHIESDLTYEDSKMPDGTVCYSPSPKLVLGHKSGRRYFTIRNNTTANDPLQFEYKVAAVYNADGYTVNVTLNDLFDFSNGAAKGPILQVAVKDDTGIPCGGYAIGSFWPTKG